MSQTFAKLFLDQTRIEDAVKNFDSGSQVSGPTDRGQFVEYVVERKDELPATVHFYFRADSTTTINPKVGRNQPLSTQIAEHVAAQCQKKEFQPQPLVLASISQDDWEWLIKHLEEDHGYTVTTGNLQHGVRLDVKKSSQDYVNLNRYNNGRFMMQGKAREVYSTVAMTLCDLVPDKQQIVTAQLVSYKVEDINAAALIEEVKERVPSGHDILGDAGTAILAPALALMKLEIELTDYSVIAYPALRALEGYMKGLMAKHDQPVLNAAGFGNYFLGDHLKSGVRDKIGCEKTVDALEQSYVLYNQHRHSLFHVDANVELSRIIEKKSEAVTIVQDVLRTIEETSSHIPL